MGVRLFCVENERNGIEKAITYVIYYDVIVRKPYTKSELNCIYYSGYQHFNFIYIKS